MPGELVFEAALSDRSGCLPTAYRDRAEAGLQQDFPDLGRVSGGKARQNGVGAVPLVTGPAIMRPLGGGGGRRPRQHEQRRQKQPLEKALENSRAGSPPAGAGCASAGLHQAAVGRLQARRSASQGTGKLSNLSRLLEINARRGLPLPRRRGLRLMAGTALRWICVPIGTKIHCFHMP